jgi:hypothetical protein
VRAYLALDDLGGQVVKGVCVEGVVEGGHFVEDAAEGPDVRLVVVGLVFEDLRRHVVGGSDAGSSKVLGALHHLTVGREGCVSAERIAS